jgi:hypothetical protein
LAARAARGFSGSDLLCRKRPEQLTAILAEAAAAECRLVLTRLDQVG